MIRDALGTEALAARFASPNRLRQSPMRQELRHARTDARSQSCAVAGVAAALDGAARPANSQPGARAFAARNATSSRADRRSHARTGYGAGSKRAARNSGDDAHGIAARAQLTGRFQPNSGLNEQENGRRRVARGSHQCFVGAIVHVAVLRTLRRCR